MGVRIPKATFLMGTGPLPPKSWGKPGTIVHGPGPSKLWLRDVQSEVTNAAFSGPCASVVLQKELFVPISSQVFWRQLTRELHFLPAHFCPSHFQKIPTICGEAGFLEKNPLRSPSIPISIVALPAPWKMGKRDLVTGTPGSLNEKHVCL